MMMNGSRAVGGKYSCERVVTGIMYRMAFNRRGGRRLRHEWWGPCGIRVLPVRCSFVW